MARKRYLDEDALKVLHKITVHLHDGPDVLSSCRKAEISDKTCYYWRKKFGGIGACSFPKCVFLAKRTSAFITAHGHSRSCVTTGFIPVLFTR